MENRAKLLDFPLVSDNTLERNCEHQNRLSLYLFCPKEFLEIISQNFQNDKKNKSEKNLKEILQKFVRELLEKFL